MNRSCLLALATMTVLTACGSSKPAPSDESVKLPDSAVTPAVVAPSAAEPSAPAVPTAPSTKPAVMPAAKPVRPATGTAAPAAAKPVAVPPSPVVAPTPAPVPAVTPAPAPAAAPSAPRGDPLAGKLLYDAQCRKCHGVIGVPPKAIKEKFPKLLPFDAEFVGKTTDEAIVTILVQGKGDDMKSFKDKLTRAEMVSVAAYVRTLSQRP